MPDRRGRLTTGHFKGRLFLAAALALAARSNSSDSDEIRIGLCGPFWFALSRPSLLLLASSVMLPPCPSARPAPDDIGTG